MFGTGRMHPVLRSGGIGRRHMKIATVYVCLCLGGFEYVLVLVLVLGYVLEYVLVLEYVIVLGYDGYDEEKYNENGDEYENEMAHEQEGSC